MSINPCLQVILADTRGDSGDTKKQQQQPRGNKQPLPRGTVGVGAFVMPNAPIDPRTPLSAYVVPLEDLEQVGMREWTRRLVGRREGGA